MFQEGVCLRGIWEQGSGRGFGKEFEDLSNLSYLGGGLGGRLGVLEQSV